MKYGAFGIQWKEWLKITNGASESLSEYSTAKVLPAIQIAQQKSVFQIAMADMYNRMALWLKDSVIIKEPIHIQLAATCTRSMFEHLVDLKWVTLNPNSAEAFSAFTIVRRFDMADKILKESLRNPSLDLKRYRSAIELATSMKSRALRDELCCKFGWVTKTGKTKTPQHWWGENNEQRALALDPKGRTYITMYITIYGQLSNQMHPGTVGLKGISPEGVLSLFLAAHQMTQQFFCEATSLVCQYFPLPSEVLALFKEKFTGDAIYGVIDPKIILPY